MGNRRKIVVNLPLNGGRTVAGETGRPKGHKIMGEEIVTEWHRSGHQGQGSKYEGRKGIISRATRTCLERKGISKTSIADITREVDITRELFYYYFPNKDAVIASVIDGYVLDARRLIDASVEMADDTTHSLMLQVVRAFRVWLMLDNSMPLSMMDVLREACIGMETFYRVAGEAYEALRGTAALAVDAVSADSPVVSGILAGFTGALCAMQCDESLTDEDLARGLTPLLSGAESA